MQPNIWAECGLKSEEEEEEGEEEEVGAAEEAAAGCRQVVKEGEEGRRARDDGETAAILRCPSSHLSLLDA